MVNYSNGKIYKIEAIEGENHEIYVGSTTKQYLSQRMVEHRGQYARWKKPESSYPKVTSFILFDKHGVDNCQIVLLENVCCNSRDELTSREAHYIRTLKCVNKGTPHKSRKEYYQDNTARIKEYYQDNSVIMKSYTRERWNASKDELNAKLRENRFTCECGSSNIRVDKKSRHCGTIKHLKIMANKVPENK